MSFRIVIDCRHIKDFGVGTYIRNLVRSLARLDQKNRYILIAAPDALADLAGLPSNFEPAPYERADSEFVDQLAFPLFLRRFAADLRHVPHSPAPLAMPKPFVMTVHDLSSILFERPHGRRRSSLLYRFRRGLQRAATVIAVSNATRRDIEKLFGTPPERIRLIYNAPDPRFTTNEEPDNRTECDKVRQVLERYQIDYPFVLYAGAIRPQKNIPRLVEAFAVARGDLGNHPVFKDLRLIIIGDEITKYPAVRRAVIQTRAEQVVRFLGFVPVETLRIFYRAAAAFVFPSLYEGFGLPPLEAMACGTPVVCSSLSSLPEVVGDAAILVNPENVFDIARGIKEALTDESKRAALIAAGYAQARKFSWDSTARQVLDIYEEVARGGRG